MAKETGYWCNSSSKQGKAIEDTFCKVGDQSSMSKRLKVNKLRPYHRSHFTQQQYRLLYGKLEHKAKAHRAVELWGNINLVNQLH